jgi:hypothetical protein
MTEQRKRNLEVWLPIIIQTVLFLGVLVGYAMTNEHRMTVVEENVKSTAQTLQQTVATVQGIQQTQIRVVALVGEMEKRHEREDSR